MAKKAKRELSAESAAKRTIQSVVQVDARIAVGMFFTLTGTILSAFGYSTRDHSDFYTKSLGIDADLWCGVALLVFGIVMLAFGRRNLVKIEKSRNSA